MEIATGAVAVVLALVLFMAYASIHVRLLPDIPLYKAAGSYAAPVIGVATAFYLAQNKDVLGPVMHKGPVPF